MHDNIRVSSRWRKWKLTGLVAGGAVAQLGARLDGIEEVVGSNPIGSTKFAAFVRSLVSLPAPEDPSNPILVPAEAGSRAGIGGALEHTVRFVTSGKQEFSRMPLSWRN